MIDGSRLKLLRKKLKLSTEELGATLNISRQQIVRYESNKTDVTSDILVKIAQFFGVSTDYLLGLTNNMGEYENRKVTWTYDTSVMLERLPPEIVARVLKLSGIDLRVKEDEINVTELLQKFPPAYVARFLKELGVEPKFKYDE